MRTGTVRAAFACAASIVLLSAGCAGQKRPNVLLITLDTTRADHIGCYGYTDVGTPALDALAREGVRFARAFCNVPLTLPSHATIMTGLLPPEHGCRVNGLNTLAGDVPTLAETLSARGYETAAFAAAVVLDPQFGLARGFDLYDACELEGKLDPRDELALIRYRRGNAVADAALSWLDRRNARQPFFCWVHFFDPHRPYYLDGRAAPRDPVQAYDWEIAFMDRQIARLLEHLREAGLMDETVIVAVGDHGEGLNDHGEDEHGILIYDEAMRVPLIVRRPGAAGAGTVADAVVSTADVMPTLLDLLGVAPPAPVTGRSLVPCLRGEPIASEPVYFESEFPFDEYGWSPLRGAQLGDWKYIRAPREELYDLGADPGERENLALTAEPPPELGQLRDALARLEAGMQARESTPVTLDPAARRALESLGYAGGGGGGADREADDLRDPKDAVWMRRVYLDAAEALRQGRFEQAEPALRRLVEESPESLAFHFKLGELLFRQGRFDEARAVFERMAKQFPENYAPHYDLGKTLIKLGQFDRAVEELALALQLGPDKVEVHNNLGLAHLYRGDMPAAQEAFRGSIALDPDQVDPYSNLGHCLLQQGQAEEAAVHFRKALAVEPDAVGPRYNLGLALLALGRNNEAAGAFRRVIRLHPGFPGAEEKLALAEQRAQGGTGADR